MALEDLSGFWFIVDPDRGHVSARAFDSYEAFAQLVMETESVVARVNGSAPASTSLDRTPRFYAQESGGEEAASEVDAPEVGRRVVDASDGAGRRRQSGRTTLPPEGHARPKGEGIG